MALLVRDDVPFACHKTDTDIEAVTVKLYLENHQHTVCSVYLPPAETFETRKIKICLINLVNTVSYLETLLVIILNGDHQQLTEEEKN